MTREEQIKQAAEKSSEHISDWVLNFAYRAHFIAGAEYADAHPNWEAIVKRLQEEITNDLRQDRWISVEDELPKDGVLVLAFNGRDYTLSWKVRNRWHTNMDLLDGATPVTHWMPLPEPPKKDGEQ